MRQSLEDFEAHGLWRPTCDFVRGTSLAGRNHDEQLHDAIIDLRTTGLHNEDILLPNAGHDLDAGFALTALATGRSYEYCACVHWQTA